MVLTLLPWLAYLAMLAPAPKIWSSLCATTTRICSFFMDACEAG